jgi:hypothetical protein
LTNVILGKSVENINYGAFYDCPFMETINIPDSVKVIGDEAFASPDNGSLVTVTGLKNINYLGVRVFANQEELESINLPGTLKNIGRQCFKNTGIDTMTIVYNEELFIEEEAFDVMPNLRILNLVGGTPMKWKSKLNKQDFEGCDLLLEKAAEYGIERVVDYVVNARKLEQESMRLVGKNITDMYFRLDMREW